MTFVSDFIKKVTETYSSGHAREHSYRPALKELFEKITGLNVINEPKRSEHGALAKYKYYHKDVQKGVKALEGHTQTKFNSFMKGIKSDKNVSFNWSDFSNIFPMKISDKYTYTDNITEKYKKYLKSKKP